MKKTIRLMTMFLAGLFIFAACSDDDDPEPDLAAPRFMDWKVNGEDTREGEHSVGDSIHFQFTARADEGLDKLTIIEIADGTKTLAEIDLSDEGNVSDIWFGYKIENDEINQIEFILRDQENQEIRRTYTITIVSDGLRESQDVVLMGADQNPDHPSFLNAFSFTGYMVGNAEANQEVIDFIYFYGSTFGATMAAPAASEPEQFTVYRESANLENWGTRNATEFRTNGAMNYDNVSSNTELQAYWETGSSYSHNQADDPTLLMGEMEEGAAYLYRLSNGTIGAFEVVEIQPERSGFIRINLKVQD